MDDIELIVKSIDELRTDMRNEFKEVKTLFADHVKCCKEEMQWHDKRIRKNEQFTSRVTGGLIVLGSLLTLVIQRLMGA